MVVRAVIPVEAPVAVQVERVAREVPLQARVLLSVEHSPVGSPVPLDTPGTQVEDVKEPPAEAVAAEPESEHSNDEPARAEVEVVTCTETPVKQNQDAEVEVPVAAEEDLVESLSDSAPAEAEEHGQADEYADAVVDVPVQLEMEPAETKAAEMSATVLDGHWRCVDTFGLDEFLTATGVGYFQRKLAAAAAWPKWEFKVEGDVIKFVNHSALGPIKEDMQLNGATYTWKDGKGNPLESTACWEGTADGGTLTIRRSGALASYTEERCISGDKLAFRLTDSSGVSWGRNFVHSP